MIRTDEQSLSPGAIVSLYTLTTPAGTTLRFTPGPLNGQNVRYQGQSYRPVPVRLEGLKVGGRASSPPTLRHSALDADIVAALAGADDWRGGTVTRLKTLAKYLDGQSEADPARHWPLQTWRVERLASRDDETVTWELASPLDTDAFLPGRQILRDVCSWTYRRRAGNAWDYSEATCPYNGASMFTDTGQATNDPAKDRCSRRVESGCRKRYPAPAALPFGGFLGVGRRA